MPYIKRKDRKVWDEVLFDIDTIMSNQGSAPGDLNFLITSIIQRHINTNQLRYTTLNEVIGVLECAKLELYRRFAAPYEDQKIKENGDVNDLVD